MRELIEAGEMSNAQIAGILNGEFKTSFTRSSVIGRAHRLGIKSVRRVGVQSDRPKTRRIRKPKAPSRTVMRIIGDRPSLVPEYVQAPPPVTDIVPLRVTFAELQPGQCKFECSGMSRVVDYRFCGLPADGPWCPTHHALCWQPKRGRVERPFFPRRRAA